MKLCVTTDAHLPGRAKGPISDAVCLSVGICIYNNACMTGNKKVKHAMRVNNYYEDESDILVG